MKRTQEQENLFYFSAYLSGTHQDPGFFQELQTKVLQEPTSLKTRFKFLGYLFTHENKAKEWTDHAIWIIEHCAAFPDMGFIGIPLHISEKQFKLIRNMWLRQVTKKSYSENGTLGLPPD